MLLPVPHEAGLQARLTTELQSLANHYRTATSASGLIIVVGKGNQIVATATAGTRSSRSSAPVLVNDTVMIGSVSKSLTAGLVAVHVDRGTVTWGTTLGEVFPELRSTVAGANVSANLEQILCHRSGLALPFAPKIASACKTSQEFHLAFVQAAFALPTVGRVGEKYHYNGSGGFSAAILEKKTGKSYETLMSEVFFTPLTLKTFSMGRPWVRSPSSSVVSEILQDGQKVEAPPTWQPQLNFDASGGWSCSLPDLVKFAMVFCYNSQPRLISSESLRRLFSSPYSDGYGLGWGGNDPWRTNAGSTALGDTTVLSIAPQNGVSFAFFFNRNTGDPGIKTLRDKLVNELKRLCQSSIR